MTKKVTKTIFQTNGTFQGEKVSHFNNADTLESDVCLRTFKKKNESEDDDLQHSLFSRWREEKKKDIESWTISTRIVFAINNMLIYIVEWNTAGVEQISTMCSAAT